MLRLFVALAFVVLASPSAWAEPAEPAVAEAGASAWAAGEQADLRLIAAVQAVGDKDSVPLGLQFRLKPGWKIYWRSPGDAGLPPTVAWDGSTNLKDTVLSWPLPERFAAFGLQTVGYKDEVVLPVLATLHHAGQALEAKAQVDYLACNVLCVPVKAALSLTLPAGAAEPSPFAHDIARFAESVPGEGSRHGLSVLKAEVVELPAPAIRVLVAADPPLTAPDMLIERGDGMQFDPPRVHLEQGGRRAMLEALPVPKTGTAPLAGTALTLTVFDGQRGIETTVVPQAGVPARRGVELSLSMLGLALLGGFILNLMPCVLPVLSLKVLGVVGLSGGARRQVRAGFLASAAGIVATFLALAGVAVAVKAAGIAVGWGIQFQQPLFLAALVLVLTVFAANLWGWFHVPLPGWLGGLGGGLGAPHSLAGHFLAGAFATVLATPCTAPFLGTAVGFALARGPVEIAAVFLALGLGMASPYLAVALWPGLALRLPRPGRWMLALKRLLGLALLGTAVWLVTVLAAEAGKGGALAVGALMAALLALLALRPHLSSALRPLAALAMVAVGVAALAAPSLDDGPASVTLEKGHWVAFDRTAIPRLVAEGRTVFVDVTADWCLTCQVNKAAVLNRPPVQGKLSSADVVAMRADWTRPDPAIADYLATFGRYGIPFNAVYGPGAPEGLALPELLSRDAVMAALERAGRR